MALYSSEHLIRLMKNGSSFHYTFERGSIQGILNLKVVMYMKEPKERNGRYTIESGTILGELETYKIYIDGSGSLFPIKEVNSPKSHYGGLIIMQ